MVAFIEGCNQANAGSLLTGFREWLVTKAGCGDELVWWALTGHLAEPVGRKPVHDMTPEQDRQPSMPLFDLLDDFLALRSEHGGLIQIYEAHLKEVAVRATAAWLPRLGSVGVSPRRVA